VSAKLQVASFVMLQPYSNKKLHFHLSTKDEVSDKTSDLLHHHHSLT
jgi:hypothetical protein